ncbi:MAG: helix-turn-helix domain-containing GNAT family N-acetyltransferase [Ilumatobacteraceae bacterium]
MADSSVVAVRRFNRTVTERVGALEDRYLGRRRPLGASRVLWEIGDGGCEVRVVRARLGLDSGYVSRILRSLENEGLVTVLPDATDRRVRRASLTAAGRIERDALDRASDALARSLLAPLDGGRRVRLVEAMSVVERLLTAGLVDVASEDPTSADARACLESYYAELDVRFDGGFDPALSNLTDLADLAEPAGLLLVARVRGEPVGCGALRFHGSGPAEIKRMWVSPRSRGLGVGRRLLGELEAEAHRRGVRRTRLETNRALGEALALYRSAGYREVEAFNDERYGDHWFEKRLTG